MEPGRPRPPRPATVPSRRPAAPAHARSGHRPRTSGQTAGRGRSGWAPHRAAEPADRAGRRPRCGHSRRPAPRSQGPRGRSRHRRGRRRERTETARAARPGRRRAHSAASRSATTGRRSARPPTRPVSGEQTMFRTRSCVGCGNRPAPARASTRPATADPSALVRTPRSCRFARDVSWTSPSAYSAEAALSAWSAAAAIRPPGIRTRSTAPSTAWCGRSTPGHRSASARVVTGPWCHARPHAPTGCTLAHRPARAACDAVRRRGTGAVPGTLARVARMAGVRASSICSWVRAVTAGRRSR